MNYSNISRMSSAIVRTNRKRANTDSMDEIKSEAPAMRTRSRTVKKGTIEISSSIARDSATNSLKGDYQFIKTSVIKYFKNVLIYFRKKFFN